MFIGKRLKEMRLNKHLTQEALGNLLNVSKVAICGYEKGTLTPSMEMFEHIIDTLEVSPSYLLGLDNEVVSDSSSEYKIKISDEDLKIIKELKKHRKLYNLLCNDLANELDKISKE